MSVTVRLVATVEKGDDQYLQFYNIIVRSCLQMLNLDEIGRYYYDKLSAIQLHNLRLELWPGYITSMRNHENRIMLCVEVTHKVLRQDSCLQLIHSFRSNQQALFSELIGNVVMTHYNRKTYRVDDIDWDKNPKTEFEQDGEMVSLAKYYETRYGLSVTDWEQPLLVSRPKARDTHRGQQGPIWLIPEFCQMTGLSNEHRNNFQTMQALAVYTKQDPQRRVHNVCNFMSRLLASTPVPFKFQKIIYFACHQTHL